MRLFAIKNEYRNNRVVAYLFYYKKKKKFIVELLKNSDEWNTPLLLSSFAKRGIKTVNPYASKLWVKQRIIPIDRQNIAQILIDNNMKEYDEFKFLVLAKGRCCQDDFFLDEIKYEDLPKDILKRQTRKVDEVIPLKHKRIAVAFVNKETKICDISKMIDKNSPLAKLLRVHPEVFDNVKIEVGGHGIYWDENMFITSEELYNYGVTSEVDIDDIKSFIKERTVNTAEACEILNCTRQYIEYLIKNKKLMPIKTNDKSKLFLKSDIEKAEWF